MAYGTPVVQSGKLSFFDEYEGRYVFVCDIRKDWQHWQDWLNDENHKSVRILIAGGVSCTLVKEKRKHYGGDLRPVWYAHKRLGGKLKRRYIGKSENCTDEKLRAAAIELSQRELKTENT